MSYMQLPLGKTNPGLVVVLIEQSSAMAASFGSISKAEFAAKSANRIVYELSSCCRSGELFVDRCTVALIGYGSETRILAGGTINDLNSQIVSMETEITVMQLSGSSVDITQSFPVWLEAKSQNGSPLHDALSEASQLISAWIDVYSHCFPPIIVNIMGGPPDDYRRALSAAKSLVSLKSDDGHALLFNCLLTGTGQTIFPDRSWSSLNEVERIMFECSSEVPISLLRKMRSAGYDLTSGSRGFMIDQSPEIIAHLLPWGSFAAW